MDKKEFLCRYHNLKLRIEKVEDYIDFCDERSKSVPGPSYGDMPRNPNAPTEAPFVKWIYKMLDAQEELKKLKEKATSAKNQIESAIAEIDDESLQQLLVYRYIDWLSWSEIESRLYISQTTRKRWHDKALELLVIKKT